tara:strand:+ start:273 stop:1043 length:771 start_codon:yes stop_codon:yes gene_type:complete
MALTDKTVANTYKDLLHLNNSNSGATANGTVVQDGNGTNTGLTLGTGKVKFTPSADSTTTMLVQNASGTNILNVDSTNNVVKAGETLSNVNTQYLRFFVHDLNVDNGTHIGVPFYAGGVIPNAAVTFGTSANPSAPSVSNNGDDWIHYLHYVDTDITIDAVNVLVGATAATGDSINFHLLNLATGDSTTIDEWSSTTVVADQSSVTVNAGYEQFYRVPLDIQSADVASGNYLALTIEGNGTNSDYSVNALVRYHLR